MRSEVLLILAFLHYWIGVSLDHAREILQFFTGLELSKSQAVRYQTDRRLSVSRRAKVEQHQEQIRSLRTRPGGRDFPSSRSLICSRKSNSGYARLFDL